MGSQEMSLMRLVRPLATISLLLVLFIPDHARALSSSSEEEKGSFRHRIIRRQTETDLAKSYLDRVILSLLPEIRTLVATAKKAVEVATFHQNALYRSFGYAIVVAAVKDIFSDWIINNRSLANLNGDFAPIGWQYAAKFGYGVGFGGPLFFKLPPELLSCSHLDYEAAVRRYGLADGLEPYFSGDSPTSSETISSLSSSVAEFDVMVKTALDCVLAQTQTMVEAAEVEWRLDELLAAINGRIELEEESLAQMAEEEEEERTDGCLCSTGDTRRLSSAPSASLLKRPRRSHGGRYKRTLVDRGGGVSDRRGLLRPQRRYRGPNVYRHHRLRHVVNGGGGGRRRQGGGSSSSPPDGASSSVFATRAADLDRRIEAVLAALKAKIPIAIPTIESYTARINRENAFLGASNLLGALGSMLLGANGEPYFGNLGLGAQNQVVAQFLYGYGYWGPFMFDLKWVALGCNGYDLQIVLDRYRFLTDMESNFGPVGDLGVRRPQLNEQNHPTILAYQAVVMNHDMKRALYCIIKEQGDHEDALYVSTLVDLYTQLITERLSTTGEAMDAVIMEEDEGKEQEETLQESSTFNNTMAEEDKMLREITVFNKTMDEEETLQEGSNTDSNTFVEEEAVESSTFSAVTAQGIVLQQDHN